MAQLRNLLNGRGSGLGVTGPLFARGVKLDLLITERLSLIGELEKLPMHLRAFSAGS